ncbi:hypothetical protein BR93DRAFT_562069 [Coniochaeta sp. PMI_546]|nr:hypothetical protein BR93DRAFT_562069 [Coniochaeta sp. PMI_546]
MPLTPISFSSSFQYPIPDDVHDDDVKHYLDRALGSFVAMEKELAVYEALRDQPHPNIVRRLETDQPDCLFLERLQPLQEAWSQSEDADRHRWANELLSALSWLEHLGFAHGDLAVRNLAVDATKRLKLFDFGSAVPRDHYDYAADVKRDHFDLATCLHFILTGVDPFAEARSARDVAEVRKRLAEGRGSVEAGAEDLADVIQDGWTGRAGITAFGALAGRVAQSLGPAGADGRPGLSDDHYQRLKVRCVEWLNGATRNPLWLDAEQYCAACRARGYEVDMDMWR